MKRIVRIIIISQKKKKIPLGKKIKNVGLNNVLIYLKNIYFLIFVKYFI